MAELSILSFALFLMALVYVFTALYLISHPQPLPAPPRNLPEFAVLVAMRDEEKYIADCLRSLETQDYPSHLYDVYIIDDHCSDRSPEIVKKFVAGNPNFHLITVESSIGSLKGKMNALALALDKTDKGLVLITDADCVVPSSWIRTYASYFNDDTGMVGGLTSLTPSLHIPLNAKQSFFGGLQTLDWIYLQALAAATSNADKPITILGNNFAFRMDAYKEVGGFRGIGFSVTEDFALMKAIQESTDWKIRYTLDPGNTIFSHPLEHLSEFFSQRLRWIRGGRSMRPWAYYITGLSFITRIVILINLLAAQWNLASAAGIGLVVGIDYMIINRELRKLKLKKVKKYFLGFEFFYFFYMIVFGLLSIFPLKITWKGRRLS